jgi:hypothetical protein
MAKPEWKIARICLWWGCALACLVALIQGSGSITKFAVIGLVVCGSSAATLAAIEHGWHKAPYWIGTPLRFTLLVLLLWTPLSMLGWFVWPKDAPQTRTGFVVLENGGSGSTGESKISSPMIWYHGLVAQGKQVKDNLAPIDMAILLSISNTGSNPSEILSYEAEAEEINGQWVPLCTPSIAFYDVVGFGPNGG